MTQRCHKNWAPDSGQSESALSGTTLSFIWRHSAAKLELEVEIRMISSE